MVVIKRTVNTLADAITEAEAVDTTGKTDESATALKDAIDAAKVIDAKADATQKEVDDAKDAIATAKANLKDKAASTDNPYTHKTSSLKKGYGDDFELNIEMLKDGKEIPEAEAREATIEINGTSYGKMGDLISRYFYGTYRITDLTPIKKEISEDTLKVKITFKDGKSAEATIKNELTPEERAKVTGKKVDPKPVDKAALKTAITEAEAVDTTGKTDESATALKDAIDAAKVIDAKADATQKEVDDAKARIEAAKSDLKDKPTGVTIIDLNKYNDYANAFYYVDKSIGKYIDNDVYFSLKGGLMHTLTKVQQSVNNHEKMDLLSVLGGFQAGFSMPLENSMTRVGGFFEYDNRKLGDHRVDHFGLGTSMKTENIEAFLRYRLAKYRSKSNHNVDAYVNYRYDYQALDNFRITPSADLYMTYSSKVTLDKDVELASRFGAMANAAVQFTYMNKPMNFEVYAKPELGFGYNDQLIKQKLPAGYERNELKIERGYFNYAFEIGANKQLGNGIKLFINTRMQGNKTHNPDYTANIGLGYSWK